MRAIVLAAGGSRRFGSAKGLANFAGQPLVRHTVTRVSDALGARVTVVLGFQSTLMQDALDDLDVDIVINDNWSSGLASSLKTGIHSLPDDTAAAMVALADQALIKTADYQRLLAAATQFPDRPIAAHYAGTLGVPAVFPSAYFDRLCELQGDRGAGSLLTSLSEVIPIDLPAASMDIDTPAQLAEALGRST